jgi:hypothetical protein
MVIRQRRETFKPVILADLEFRNDLAPMPFAFIGSAHACSAHLRRWPLNRAFLGSGAARSARVHH